MALFHIQFETDGDRRRSVEILDGVGDARHGLSDNRMLVNEQHLEALRRNQITFRFVRPGEVCRGPRPSVSS